MNPQEKTPGILALAHMTGLVQYYQPWNCMGDAFLVEMRGKQSVMPWRKVIEQVSLHLDRFPPRAVASEPIYQKLLEELIEIEKRMEADQ